MSFDQELFPNCEICGTRSWAPVYEGRVRDGVVGSYRDGAVVAECGGCGVRRLDEEHCQPDSIYETDAYRALLKRGLDSRQYFVDHDELQPHTLRVAWPFGLRGATVADVGCGGGSLLDCLRGIAGSQIAIEPYSEYRADLGRRGYDTYAYASEAVGRWAGQVDFVFSIQVIEHTQNPRQFLEQIRPLLAPSGKLIISTPNVKDILMNMLPDDFPPFFYRTVHRWYFDAHSLSACAKLAGFETVSVQHVHRFGLSNAFIWARDRVPSGNRRIDGLSDTIDADWKSYLEASGQSDWVFLVLELKG